MSWGDRDVRGEASRLPGTVLAAAVCMGINATAGLFLGLVARGHPRAAAAGLISILWGAVWIAVAVGSAQLRSWARPTGITLATIGIVWSLFAGRIEISTNLVILLTLLSTSASRAFEEAAEPAE
ncbi:MAG: hypothetical protein HY775_00250 [Acidobacteria bacterium]|nr:hypothetical protein [Acidobacteriota bacterium]